MGLVPVSFDQNSYEPCGMGIHLVQFIESMIRPMEYKQNRIITQALFDKFLIGKFGSFVESRYLCNDY